MAHRGLTCASGVFTGTMSDFTVNPLVWIGVGSTFAFSGLFYRLYHEKKKELEKLKV